MLCLVVLNRVRRPGLDHCFMSQHISPYGSRVGFTADAPGVIVQYGDTNCRIAPPAKHMCRAQPRAFGWASISPTLPFDT